MTAGGESQHRRIAYLSWLAVCVLWGTTYLGIRIALETFPPALLGGIRYTAAGVLLSSILMARGRGGLVPRSQWAGLALIGLLTVGIGNGGVIWAEQWVPSGVAAVTVATVPFWMIGIEAFTSDGDPLSARLILGLLIGFSGILLLVWPDVAGGVRGRQYLVGIIGLQIACVGWAIGSALSRRHARNEHVLAAAAMQMTFGGLFMLAAGTARGEWSQLAFSTRSVVAEIYLTVVGSIVGYSAYTYALRYLPTATVSLYAYANPVIAIALGVLLADEPFGARVVIASMMVLTGSALVQWRKKKETAVATNRRHAAA